MADANIIELTKQIEYYFSDKNLEFDQFFHAEIEGSPEGFVALDILLQCNKVKKLGATIDTLQTAIARSEALELSEDKLTIRRADKTLPEFKGIKGKKPVRKASVAKSDKSAKSGKSKGSKAAEEEKDEEAHMKEKFFLAWVLYIPDASDLPKNGKMIEECIAEQYKMDVPFARINKTTGNVVFDRYQANPETVLSLLDHGFEVEGKKVSIIEANDKEKNFFFRENGHFLDKIIKKKYSKRVQRSKREADKKKEKTGPVTFSGKKYRSLDDLKTVFKNLLSKTRNGGEIDEKHSEMLKVLLKFHEKKEEKNVNVKGFTVDFHPIYKQTRCFFIIKDDDTKEDFSLHKCLNNFKDDQA